MAEYRIIDQQNWPRKQHYEFYRGFEQPYFNIVFDIDAKGLYQVCKQHKIQFFHAYCYLLMKIVNSYEPFRLRVVESQVRDYKTINLSCTTLAEDQCIRFSEANYDDSFAVFADNLVAAQLLAVNRDFLHPQFEQLQQHKDTVYLSVIPWISFSGFNHAWHSKDPSGVPRIAIGKMRPDYTMPISIDVHHGLVDGMHVGVYTHQLQHVFDNFNPNS